MKRIHVFAEGYTEQEFLNKLIRPYLEKENPSLSLTVSVVKTSKDARGGVVNYHKVKNEIIRTCQQTSHPFVTTMFDLFRLPKDFPGSSLIRGAARKNNRWELSQSCKFKPFEKY